MKVNEVLKYPLADIGPHSPVMTLHLHRTPSGYWQFCVGYNLQVDIADRLFNSLSEHTGLADKVTVLFNKIPRKGRFYPCMISSSALFGRGRYFPDRNSVIGLIENAYLPYWKYVIGKIMENYIPGVSWLRAVRKTEEQLRSAMNHTLTAEM